ncbi:MAG: class I SAM-dependent methyltransferase [Pirellulales bacterium]
MIHDSLARPIAAPLLPSTASASWLQRTCRRLFLSRLDTLREGRIALHFSGQAATVGTSDGEPTVCWDIHDPAFFVRAVTGGSLGVAESYLRGEWDCDDLLSLFRLFARNMSLAQSGERGLARLGKLAARFWHAARRNSLRGSRRNIEAHYDLGNDFFSLMLDETMAYSSGIFLQPDSTLEEASREKFDRLCRKLALRPGDHLLEIGSGWGGMALHAAAEYGCRVTTTTISPSQREYAQAKIDAAGLAGRITLLGCDYRDLRGQYDKLVSVEMIEAVGRRYLPGFFRQISRLLKPDGRCALQAILIPDQRDSQYLRSVDFIQKYVFPGGCLPSMASIHAAVADQTDLRLVHFEEISPHYARTLDAWRQRFESRLAEVRQLGYPERFVRLWRYYLSYCQAGFAERAVSVAQMQFDKPRIRHDPLEITNRAAGASCGAELLSACGMTSEEL